MKDGLRLRPMIDVPEGLVEKVAKRIAVANNGGEWSKHYTDHQKAIWRMRAAEILAEVAKALQQNSENQSDLGGASHD